MKRSVMIAFVVIVAAIAGLDRAAAQQDDLRGQVRGQVLDPQGQGIPQATIVMEVEGKRPKKFTLTTDKRGGFIRVGIPGGTYKLTLSKDGYKTSIIAVHISLGGLSEIPPMTMHPLDAGAAGSPIQGAAGTAAPSTLSAAEYAKIKENFAQAVAAFQAGQIEEAEALYREVLTIAPQSSEAHYNLGYLNEKKKDLAAAEAEYRQAMELDPSRSDSYISQARVLDATGKNDQATQLLREAATRFEQDAQFQFQFGIRCFDIGLADEAEAALRKAQALDATNVETVYYLGLIAVQKGRVEDAVARLEQYAAQADQNAANVATARAIILELKKSSPKP